MLGRIHAIALNTFREAVRSKVLYAILFFALLLIASSLVLAELSLNQHDRVVKNLGLATITLFSVLVAIVTGVSLLHQEIEKKTIYTIVPKPIERWHFLVGKYAGIVMTVAVEMALMSLILGLLMVARGVDVTWALIAALGLAFVEVCIIAAFAMVFSAFSSPFLSGMLAAMLFVVGNLHDQIARLATESASALSRALLRVAEVIVPDLTLFNLSRAVTYDASLRASEVAWPLGVGAAYIALLLLIGVILFERRDFI